MSVRTHCRANRSGFTLVEILVVVVIIGILASLAAVRMAGQADKGRIAATRSNIAATKAAIALYELDYSKYPGTLEELLKEDTVRGRGPYFAEDVVPQDGWEHAFRYTVHDRKFTVVSAGKDGLFDTEDDIK